MSFFLSFLAVIAFLSANTYHAHARGRENEDEGGGGRGRAGESRVKGEEGGGAESARARVYVRRESRTPNECWLVCRL